MENKKPREQWSGRLGFVLATAGSAVGLGNIMKFPWMTGQNGGAAFLFVYIIIMLIIGIIASIVATILSKNHANIAGYFNTINDISELFVMYYVISGCVSIAQTKKHDKLAATGNRVKIYIIVIWVIGLVINFFKGSFEAKGAASAGGVIYIVLAVVGAVATLVSYIAYLVILRKTIDSI